MDRTQFLQICQAQAVKGSQLVKYGKNKYIPLFYSLKFDVKGNPIHTAVIKDISANCIMDVRLQDVEEV